MKKPLFFDCFSMFLFSANVRKHGFYCGLEPLTPATENTPTKLAGAKERLN